MSVQVGAKQVLFELGEVRDRIGRLIQIWVHAGDRGKDFANWVIDTKLRS